MSIEFRPLRALHVALQKPGGIEAPLQRLVALAASGLPREPWAIVGLLRKRHTIHTFMVRAYCVRLSVLILALVAIFLLQCKLVAAIEL